jgi:transcriptional regulator with XRE-family HTH domain
MQEGNPIFVQSVANDVGAGVCGRSTDGVATDNDKKSLAAAVARLRDKRALSQDELGRLIGKNGQTISNIETAKVFPRGETYRALAAGLGMTVDELDGEWKDRVAVMLPRAAYDEIQTRAAEKKMGVEAWIIRAAGHHRTEVSEKVKTRGRAGERRKSAHALQ